MSTLQVRAAEERDAPAIAAVHVRSWQGAYRGLMPDLLLDGLSVSEREQSWRALLRPGVEDLRVLVAAEPGGELTGFCALSLPSRDDDADDRTAELSALYVDPRHWRRGVGAALLTSAREELRGGDWRELALWVLRDNERAVGFYERRGFAADGGRRRDSRSGQPVIRLRAGL